MTCCGLNDSSLRTCNFLEHEFSHTRVACPPCLRNWSRGTGAAKNIDATYGFHSAGVVEHDGTSPGLCIFALRVFCGPKEIFVLRLAVCQFAQALRISNWHAREATDFCCRP